MLPIGRPVAKGAYHALEYDPTDAPEFVQDEFGNGFFSWEPVTPEGIMAEPGTYHEMAIPVPEDRLNYLRSGGFLEGAPDDDCRAYIGHEIFNAYGREWRHITLKGNVDAVQAAERRLMAGVLRRRPWDPAMEMPPPPEETGLGHEGTGEAATTSVKVGSNSG